jgi:putative transport protein
MVDLLADSPTLLLFVVAALGYLLGRIGFRGFSLGVAAVLFAGIAVGAIDERLRLPEPVWVLGLALFVYTVGLASGPGFVAALRRRGVTANAAVLATVALGAGGALGAAEAVGVGGATATGAFAGGLTNTPALAGALEYLKANATAETFERLQSEPVVGYSLTYPLGVLLPLFAVFLVLRRSSARGGAAAAEPPHALVSRTAAVERAPGGSLGELAAALGGGVTFGRLKRAGELVVATPDLVPRPGDLVSVIGEEADVARAIERLGAQAAEHLPLDRRSLDFRRIVVSDRRVAGRHVADLDVGRRFGATVTRVRRGDVDFVAHPETVLELGDHVRVVAPRARLGEVSRFFGDSYRALRELDVLTFSVGIALGLLLGSVPFPLPGGGEFELGFAGGPLVVGLALGALGRTGPLVWQLPHAANLTLRQLGTVLFLAGVGTRSGQAFADTITSAGALEILAVGAVVTLAAIAGAVLAGMLLLRLSAGALAGVVAGLMTQPAVLAFASDNARDENEVTLGYAMVYPVAMIAKIVTAQLVIGATL